MIVAVTVADTADVLTLNVTVVDPPGTVTVSGTAALALLEASFIVVPVEGALALIVTVPVVEFPPTTDVGERVTPVKTGTTTLRV